MTGDGIYIGVDVGTASARAGLFDERGGMLATASAPLEIWRPREDFVEQSSDDIWKACCQAVHTALEQSGASAMAVRGIGFDATCSLVALDAEDRPVTVSPSGRDEQNVIVWMDHRAIEQAERINAGGHEVLKYVGGVISPEMETPKLLWLKENSPRSWDRGARFFDLPDFLTYRATGDDTRSLCSTVCKWTYLGHEEAEEGSVGRWDGSYFQSIGLGELVDEGYRRIGRRVLPMGQPLGRGLTDAAARELGLRPGTAVSVSIIDAHAGGLGLLGAELAEGEALHHRLALIGGTSSCHMAVGAEPAFIDGVWGPFFSAMVPGLWLSEGGQSATGALIDHLIDSHARGAELRREAAGAGTTAYALLNRRLDRLAESKAFPAELTSELHVLPYFHGNRSPRADPTLRGVISGLRLRDGADELALLYLATVQAIAYGTRHIVWEMQAAGLPIESILMCGGGTKNPIFLREHADITGCPVILPKEPEAVLLGSAILGAVAAGDQSSVIAAMGIMGATGERIDPADGATARYHDAKYAIFGRMYVHQREYRELIEAAAMRESTVP